MHRTVLTTLAALAFALSLQGCATCPPCPAKNSVSCPKGAPANAVRHVVCFKYKDGTSAEQIKTIEKAFADLPSKIPGIVGFEWGTNTSPEGLAQGCTHCFLLTFKDAAARDAYLPHPEHKAFGKILGPHLDKVFVIDYTPVR